MIDTGFDYSATDTLVPHPLYGSFHWVSVVYPGVRTQVKLAGLTEQAHALAKRQYDRQRH